MPRAYDQRQLVVDRDPLKQLSPDPGRLPKLDPSVFWDGLVNGIKDLFGIDLSSPAAFVTSVLDALQNLFNPQNIMEAITGVAGATIQTVANFFGGLTALGGSLIEQIKVIVGDLGEVIRGVLGRASAGVAEFTEWLLGLLGFGGIHAAGSLFGTGQVGNVNPELLINGAFDGAASMPNTDAGGWSWDDTVDHTGREDSGSAKVIANGTPRSMLSNSIDVVESNRIDASVWVKWSGRAGSGPVSLVLNIYDADDALLDTAVFATASSGATSDWVQLSGSYTVPEKIAGKTPTHACAGFLIDEKVTAGTFWWDDASLKKINPISHKLVDGFQDAMDDVTETVGAGFTDFVNALKSFDRIKTGTIIDDFIPGIGRLIENGVRGLLGLPPPTDAFSHEDFLAAATSQAESITGTGNSIAAIWQYLNAGVYDEFERTGALGSNWSTQWGSGNGSISCEGRNAALPFAWPGGNSEWFTRWTGSNASSVSDYQQVSIVLSSSPGTAPFGYDGGNFVIARVGGSTHYIKFRVSGDGSWAITKVVNSVEYPMLDATSGFAVLGGPGNISRPAPGSIITLYAGDKATTEPRRFRVTINNTTLCNFVEKTSVAGVPDSVFGASYRGRGFGMRAESIAFLTAGWVGPGLVNYWASSDQP